MQGSDRQNVSLKPDETEPKDRLNPDNKSEIATTSNRDNWKYRTTQNKRTNEVPSYYE